MTKAFYILLVLFVCQIRLFGQIKIVQCSELEAQLYGSSLIHQPLPIDTINSFEAAGWRKKVLLSEPMCVGGSVKGWHHSGVGHLLIDKKHTVTGKGSVGMTFQNNTGRRATGSPSDPDYATYGNCSITYDLKGANLEKYNRIIFYVYPDCDGVRIVNLNLAFSNSNNVKRKIGYNQPTGSHLINLINKQWNRCFLEIGEYQRDCVESITFHTSLRGLDMAVGDSSRFYIDGMCLQTVAEPMKVSGWMPADGTICYSTTGYETGSPKTAIVGENALGGSLAFTLTDATTGVVTFQGRIKDSTTTLGHFGLIDFSAFDKPGYYRLNAAGVQTPAFRIGASMWDNSAWRVLNFLFCQRCGHPVAGIHASCHADLMSQHNGKAIAFNGGWHDAGDLSQQALQTGDVTFSLLEAYNSTRKTNPALAARLREEAEWGLEFILKNRYGDGYRASSMGLLIWQDGVFGTTDDIKSVRVHNFAFDNFLFSAYEAYAAITLDNDFIRRDYLRKVAEEDFRMALEKFKKDGFDNFIQPYEHSYNTSESQYMATMSWAASLLYKLTGKQEYALLAAEFIRYTLECQRIKPVNGRNGLCGFFYRDKQRKSIVHYIHQSREQVYMQALSLLCETQPGHADYNKWAGSISLYGTYIKQLMSYTKPYGMIPSGVYHADEYQDSLGFYRLHLFPPTNAKELYTEQLKHGVQLNKEFYVKRFPVWFNIFNGNTAIHLSTGKAAAICGKFLKDRELTDIGREQLYWTVGKNPFGASLIYGEGHNFCQMNSFSSGEMTGEMPVGIRTLGNDDIPYWPQTNNACYKEVWVTSAGKWLSLIAEYN